MLPVPHSTNQSTDKIMKYTSLIDTQRHTHTTIIPNGNPNPRATETESQSRQKHVPLQVDSMLQGQVRTFNGQTAWINLIQTQEKKLLS